MDRQGKSSREGRLCGSTAAIENRVVVFRQNGIGGRGIGDIGIKGRHPHGAFSRRFDRQLCFGPMAD
jgi:hypothetical protein